MNKFQERNWRIALVSGVAEVFWFVFTWKWSYVYYNAPAITRFPLHVIALLWLLITNLFYTINVFYELDLIYSLEDVNWVCYSLYMTLTYFMGFSISLGFGTTHLQFHWTEWTLVTCVSGVICLTSFLEFHHSPTLSDVFTAITFVIFGVQLIVSYLTVKKLVLEYHQYKNLSGSMLIPLTYKRYRTMTIYSLILTLLFAMELLETYLVEIGQMFSGSVYVWLSSTLATVIFNSITLWVTRPRKELLTISQDSPANVIRLLLL